MKFTSEYTQISDTVRKFVANEINPFTKEETVFAAKPASTKIKVRPLKKLKDAAA